ncbi:RCC1 domain-containing protein [Fibrella arboris]|uniref:RCC1 domain-containing protein n=1 Tax=Fibrella arboris TaxID=3242486 RepID=UPI00351F9FE4
MVQLVHNVNMLPTSTRLARLWPSVSHSYRLLVGAMLLLLVFTYPATAQDGFVGDGFGGRSWYRPANIVAGQNMGAAIVNGQLYMWATPTGNAIFPILTVPSPPTSYPLQGRVDYTGTEPLTSIPGSESGVGLGSGKTSTGSTVGAYANPYPVAAFSSVKLISLTEQGGVIKTDGTGWVWGQTRSANTYGSLLNYHAPVQVVSNAKFVSAGANHSVFVKNDGTVWTVGDNSTGVYGNGTTVPDYTSLPSKLMSTTAVQMTGITNAARVVAFHIGTSNASTTPSGTVVLKQDGTVWVAGAGGVLVSTNPNKSPTQVPGLANIVDIKCTSTNAAALTNAGDVYIWGSGTAGPQYGNGTPSAAGNTYTPKKVPFPPGTPPMVMIEADGYSYNPLFYSIDENHTLWQWGINADGMPTQSDGYIPSIIAKHVLDVNLAGYGVIYITRTADYPANERLWAGLGSAGGVGSLLGLNPEYLSLGAKINPLDPSTIYTSFSTANNYWVQSYNKGVSGTYWPANPGAWGLGGIGQVETPTTIAGSVDCGATAIVGSLVAGTASNVLLKVTATVSTTGTGTFTVSGSGLSPDPSPATYTATTTGPQTFYLPMAYDGSTLGATTFTFSGLGACTADLSGLTKRPVLTPITPLVNCTPFTSVVISK